MGKSPQTFGGRGVNPDDFADDPHDMTQHEDDVAADGDPQPPEEHGDAAHALEYLLSDEYRNFVNTTPENPEDGDVVVDTEGDEVTLDVYDASSDSFVGVGTSAESYTDSDAVNAIATADGTPNRSYETLSDAPDDLDVGTAVFIEDEGTLYVEDGT